MNATERAAKEICDPCSYEGYSRQQPFIVERILHAYFPAERAERADITTFVNAQAAEFYEEMLRLCVIPGGQAYEEIKELSTRHMTALADWISNLPPKEQARG